MAIQRFNAVGGYSTGITATAVIDSLGNITGVGATFSGLIRANAGISAAGGVTLAGTLQGTTANFTGLVSSTIGFSGPGTNITGVVTSFNNQTGAVTGVTVGGTNVFTALNTFNAGISASGGATFGTNISVNSISVGRGKGNVTTNTALGTGVLSVLTPDEDYFVGTFNTGLGSQALNNLTTGQRNTAVGKSALSTATTSSYNTAVGAIALNSNTTGSYNTAIGEESLRYNTTGVENVGIGYDTLSNLTTASYNTAVGVGAGRARGSGNAFLTMISATGGIFIGHQARGSTNGQTNEIVIGRDAVGLGSNTTVLGATTAVSATIYGLVNAPSGISAAGGVTFAGTLKGVTASFTGLLSASAGISCSGIVVFKNDVYTESSLYTDSIFDNSGTVSINDRANSRVAIGDYSSNANSTFIYLRDNISSLQISNPFGFISLGDPGSIDNANFISYDAANATFSGNGTSTLDGFQTISADATILENNRRVTTNARSWFL